MMTTLTDHAPFDVIDCASGNRPLAGTASRSRLEVAEARRLVEVEPTRRSRAGYVAGFATAAVIVGGAFTTARLDDGPGSGHRRTTSSPARCTPSSIRSAHAQLWEQGYHRRRRQRRHDRHRHRPGRAR